MLSKKALYKTITWRAISTMIAFGVSYYYMDSFEIASTFTLVHAAFSTILYYLHEEFYRMLRKKGFI